MAKKLLVPLSLWVLFFFFWYQIVYSYVGNISNRLLFTLFDVTLIMGSFYFVFSFAVPALLLKKKTILFIITIIAGITAGSLLLIRVMQALLESNLVQINFAMTWNYSSLYNNRYFIALFGTVAGLITKLSIEWTAARKKIQAVEIEKTRAELQYLKNQVNPHFLFNALNTIYFQFDESADSARHSLLQFSDILRYQLYDCNEERVPVIKELLYLDNYIKIQALRKDSHCEVDFSFDAGWSTEAIAPLLLIPFVENAFKYVSDFTDRRNYILVTADKKEGWLLFSCVNTFQPAAASTGIGLMNVKRRLALLYQENHQLSITVTGDLYSVQLKIKV